MTESVTPNPVPPMPLLCEGCAEKAGLSYNEWTGRFFEDLPCDECIEDYRDRIDVHGVVGFERDGDEGVYEFVREAR